MNHEQTTVGQLTARCDPQALRAIGAPALRLRLERLLGALDLHPPGMPPGAVLVVRALHGAVPPGAQPPPGWDRQLRAAMTEHYRAAARPALAPAPADAASVLFADPGELLACLTRDLLSGAAWRHWYWQQLLRNLPAAPGPALAATWSAQAAFAPAALSRLAAPVARAALALLTPAQVEAITQALHAAFALPAPPRAITAPPAPPEERPIAPPVPAPPWRAWLPPEAAAGLTPRAHYLLGLGLALRHAPAFARSPAFANAAAAWLHAAETAALAAAPGTAHPQRSEPVAPGQAERPDQAAPDGALPDRAWSPDEVIRAMDPRRADPTSSRTPRQRAEAPEVQEDAPLPRRQPGDAAAPAVDEDPHQPTHPPQGTETAPADQAAPVATALGGVLYLVNLLRWLELPGSWSDDLAAHLGGWAIVEALGRGLLGPDHARYAADPLWANLAALDGRAVATPLGAGMAQPAHFQLPAAWLRRLGLTRADWSAAPDAGRLQLFDATAGYLVADLPLGDAPEATMATVALAYRREGIMAAPPRRLEAAPQLPALTPDVAAALSPAAGWWLTRVLGFVRYWLAHALRDPAPDLTARLLCTPGRLFAGATHVELHLPLDRIDIAVRRAGLDRDPGWTPDLGRIIRFHFA